MTAPTTNASYSEAAEILGRSANEGNGHMVITPLAWQPSDGARAKRTYFSVITGPPFGLDQVQCDDDDPAEEMLRVLAALARVRPPLVIHLTQSELQAAQLAVVIWPCEKSVRLFESVKAETK